MRNDGSVASGSFSVSIRGVEIVGSRGGELENSWKVP